MSGNPRWMYAGGQDGQSHFGGWSPGKCAALLAEVQAAAAKASRERGVPASIRGGCADPKPALAAPRGSGTVAHRRRSVAVDKRWEVLRQLQ